MSDNQGRAMWGKLYILIGVLILLSAGYHVVVYEVAHSTIHEFLFMLFTAGAGITFVSGGTWHTKHRLPEHRYLRINFWILGAGILITSLGIVSLFLGSRTVTEAELLESTHLMGSVGLTIGLFFGTMEAQLLENVRKTAQADTLESERQRLTLLNELLRHYVLNGASVIAGFAEELESSVSDDDRAAIDVIQRRAELMANIVNHISILTKTPWEQREVLEADLVAQLEQRCSDISSADSTMSVADDIPPMYANVGYDDGLSLLMEAIFQMVDQDAQLDVKQLPDGTGISLFARPASIPDNLEEEMFEPVASEVGLELYLAKTILDPAIDLDYVPRDDDVLEFHLTGEYC